MIQRGILDRVSATVLGTALTADAAVNATSLSVDWLADFEDEGGLLSLNGAVLAYTAADDDTDTLVLATPLAVAAVAGDEVQALSPAGEPKVSIEAFVQIDAGEEPVPHTISSALEGRLTEDTPRGTPVQVNTEHRTVVGKDDISAQLDGAVVWNPYLARTVATPFSVAAAGWTTVTTWADTVAQGVKVEADGSVTILYPGFYVVDASPAYVTNGTGSRNGRIMVNGVQFGYLSIPADSAGSTEVPVAGRGVLTEGDNIVFELAQSSGAALSLSNVNASPFSLYRVSV